MSVIVVFLRPAWPPTWENMKKLLSVLFATVFALTVSGFAFAADNAAKTETTVEKSVKKTEKKKTTKKGYIVRIDRLKIFLDSMGGGAWPFLVGGVICLVNSVNERDLDLLNSPANPLGWSGTS